MKTQLLYRSLTLASVLTLLASSVIAAANQPVQVKLGTILPNGLGQDAVLKKLEQDWKAASAGRVVLKKASSGATDGEAAIVRKLRSDNYQAALLSATGLSEIEPEVAALQLMPLVFQTWDEVDFIREKLRPRLEERLLAKGFVVLFWADMGWVNFFTTKKIATPSELRRLKMFAWAGDNKQVQIMKSLGYQPVPLETDYILSSFGSGMIDAAPVPPAFALGSQIQTVASHVLEVNWAPIVGAAVIRKAVWDSIPPELRPALQSHCETAGKEIRKEGRRFHNDSLNTLRKGPKTRVHSPSSDEQKQWDQLAEELAQKIRGNLVPATIYDEVQRLLKEYRADRRKASPPKV